MQENIFTVFQFVTFESPRRLSKSLPCGVDNFVYF